MTNYRHHTNFHLNSSCIPSCSLFPNLHCLFLQSRRNILCFILFPIFSSLLEQPWGVLADGLSARVEGQQLCFSCCLGNQVEMESICLEFWECFYSLETWWFWIPQTFSMPANFLTIFIQERIIMFYSKIVCSKPHCVLYQKSPKAISLAIKLSWPA